jgi:hypothetical protein
LVKAIRIFLASDGIEERKLSGGIVLRMPSLSM